MILSRYGEIVLKNNGCKVEGIKLAFDNSFVLLLCNPESGYRSIIHIDKHQNWNIISAQYPIITFEMPNNYMVFYNRRTNHCFYCYNLKNYQNIQVYNELPMFSVQKLIAFEETNCICIVRQQADYMDSFRKHDIKIDYFNCNSNQPFHSYTWNELAYFSKSDPMKGNQHSMVCWCAFENKQLFSFVKYDLRDPNNCLQRYRKIMIDLSSNLSNLQERRVFQRNKSIWQLSSKVFLLKCNEHYTVVKKNSLQPSLISSKLFVIDINQRKDTVIEVPIEQNKRQINCYFDTVYTCCVSQFYDRGKYWFAYNFLRNSNLHLTKQPEFKYIVPHFPEYKYLKICTVLQKNSIYTFWQNQNSMSTVIQWRDIRLLTQLDYLLEQDYKSVVLFLMLGIYEDFEYDLLKQTIDAIEIKPVPNNY